MIALVDVDETLAALQHQINRYANRFVSIPYRMSTLNRALREGQDEMYQKLVNEFLSQSHLSLSAPIFPSAAKALKQLKQAGYQVHIASARKENLHETTLDWLKKHRLDNCVDAVHHRSSNYKSDEFKILTARKIQAKVAFDDTYDIALALAEAGVKTYLLNKPWNKNEYLHPNMRRVRNFAAGVRQELLNHSKLGQR